MKGNIAYATPELARYFAHNRVSWDQFYESERVIIDKLGLKPDDEILDIGCGCGGLGLALKERFGVRRYTGVEINAVAAEEGRRLNDGAKIISGDVLEVSGDELRGRTFDVVFSLSCVDWNIAFDEMLAAAWKHVRAGGYLVATFRMTPGEGCSDFARSRQFINYEGRKEGELAPYVVLNSSELLDRLGALDPAEINAFGYWGAPSATAETPYERLCFAAFSIRKRDGDAAPLRTNLELPAGVFEAVE